MLLDAIVLAGGRSSRLSGVPKSQLLWHGTTLLQNTVGVALHAGARHVVVVGPDAAGQDAPGRDPRVRFVREDPPFGGPAAAVAAGTSALDSSQSTADVVLVLACDMPEVSGAVSMLVGSLPLRSGQGALMLDSAGMRQPLTAVYSRRALADAVDGFRASDTLDGASMRSLISSLDLLELTDPDGSTRDVDTWTDAAAFGIEHPDLAPHPDQHRSRS